MIFDEKSVIEKTLDQRRENRFVGDDNYYASGGDNDDKTDDDGDNDDEQSAVFVMPFFNLIYFLKFCF